MANWAKAKARPGKRNKGGLLLMYRVGFIGTGRPSTVKGPTGYAMAYEHANGYLKSGKCELAACADINDENANIFAKHYGFKKTYTDYKKMLANEKLDFVSI